MANKKKFEIYQTSQNLLVSDGSHLYILGVDKEKNMVGWIKLAWPGEEVLTKVPPIPEVVPHETAPTEAGQEAVPNEPPKEA